MTSADCSARTARSVSSSGSPEPALTSVTLPPPAGRRKSRGLHRLAPAAGGVGPAGKAARDHRLQSGADRLAEDWCRAVGRNTDDERRAVDDGAEGKIAIRGPVDDIDRNARRARGAGEALGLRLIVEAADGDGSAGKVVDPPRPLLQHDRRARGLR